MPIKENGVERRLGDKFLVSIEILENLSNRNMLYTGYLQQYELNDKGDIDIIILKNVYKHVICQKTKENTDKIKKLIIDCDDENLILHRERESRIVFQRKIAGEFMIFKYSNTININITFIKDQISRVKYLNNLDSIISIITLVLLSCCVLFPFFDLGKIKLKDKMIISTISVLNIVFTASYVSTIFKNKLSNKVGNNPHSFYILCLLLSSSFYIYLI